MTSITITIKAYAHFYRDLWYVRTEDTACDKSLQIGVGFASVNFTREKQWHELQCRDTDAIPIAETVADAAIGSRLQLIHESTARGIDYGGKQCPMLAHTCANPTCLEHAQPRYITDRDPGDETTHDEHH